MRSHRSPRRNLAVLAALLLAACGDSQGPVGPDGSVPRGTTLLDVAYCAPGGVVLRMDVFFPDVSAQALVPVAVFVHGGGWVSGNKRDSRWLDVIRDPLLASGFAVASIDYRLAPAHQWPAPLEDVRCAIRSLRARASEYGLDPSRVGIWGTSAGGHLAALAATVDEGQFEGDGEHAGHSSRVQAVVDLYGPADLTDGAGWPPGHGAVLQLVFGAHDLDDQVLVEASPTTYVSPDDPPALILHGDQDLLVPLQQSQTLFNRLAAAAVDAELVVVENAGHGLEPSGGTMRPSEAELVDQIVAFLETQLR